MTRPGTVHLKVKIDTSRVQAAFAEFGHGLKRLAEASRRLHLRMRLDRRTPAEVFSQPRPLCIDGHAYHRRTRSRRRNR